jgi:hypothetical protein
MPEFMKKQTTESKLKQGEIFKIWLVWNDDGSFVRFTNINQAREYAAERSSRAPGKHFYILESVECCIARINPVVTLVCVADKFPF